MCVVILLSACNKPRAGESVPEEGTVTTASQEPSVTQTTPNEKTDEPERRPSGSQGDELQATAGDTDGVTLQVFVPDELKSAMTALGTAFSTADNGISEVVVSSGGGAGSAIAVPNLDVVVYPSWSDMEALASASLLAGRAKTVTHLPVRIQVSGRQASSLRTPADLGSNEVRVGIPPRKQDGGAALRLLRRANLQSAVTTRTLPRGEASALQDNTIDAWIGLHPVSVGVPMRIPAYLREHQPVTAAVLKQSEYVNEGKRFLRWLEGAAAQKLWERFGTVPVVPRSLPITPTALPMKVKVPTHKAAAVVIDEKILLIGGRSSGVPVDRLAWIEPKRAASFELATKLPEGREGASAIYHRENRRVLVFAGRGPGGPLNTAVRIDPSSETVERLDIVLPDRRSGAAIARIGQSVLLFGGRTEEAVLDTVTLIDLVASQATIHNVRLPYPVASSAAAAAPNGKVWLVGGESTEGETASIIEYTHDTGAFKRLPVALPAPVMGHAAAAYGDGIVVLGGRARNKLRDAIDYVSFDGESSRMASRLLEPIGEPAAVSLDGKVYVIGGLTRDRISGGITRYPF